MKKIRVKAFPRKERSLLSEAEKGADGLPRKERKGFRSLDG